MSSGSPSPAPDSSALQIVRSVEPPRARRTPVLLTGCALLPLAGAAGYWWLSGHAKALRASGPGLTDAARVALADGGRIKVRE